MKLPVDVLSSPPKVDAAAAGRQKKNSGSPALNKACQDFEAIFLHELFKGMRSTGIESGLLEKGKEQEIFQDMLDTEVSNAAASKNTLGIAKTLLRQFDKKK